MFQVLEILLNGKRKLEKIETYNKMKDIKKRLEYLRQELRKERISYGELIELESLKEYIHPCDVELLEAAGVPENKSTN